MENALKAFKNVVEEKLRVLRNHVVVSKTLHPPFYFLKPTIAERYKCAHPFSRHKRFPRLQFPKQKETTNQGFP